MLSSAVSVQETFLVSDISITLTASSFAGEQPRFLFRKRFCCPASAFPRQHLVLLSSIRGCCVRKRFRCPASPFPRQHRRLPSSIRVCYTGNGFAVQHRRFLSSIFYANFEANHNLYVVHHRS